MQPKSIPGELVNAVQEFSNFKLKRRNDLLVIFEQAIENNDMKKLDELVFTAKYVQGLKRVIHESHSNPEVQNIEQTKKDYSENMQKVVQQLRSMLENIDQDYKDFFEHTYLAINQEAFLNLNELLNDLEWTKMYFNAQKRKEGN